MGAYADTNLLTEDQKYEFAELLEEGLDLREVDGKSVWNCRHNYEYLNARRALDQMGLTVEETDRVLEFFQEHGGYCDCEIMLNVIAAEGEDDSED